MADLPSHAIPTRRICNRRRQEHRSRNSADVGLWKALGEIKCPVTFIRGARSDRNKPEHYKRIASEFSQIRVETVDSRHDVAFEAPDELVAVVKRIIVD